VYENDNRGGQVPGQNDAVVSLVLCILSVVLWFFGYSSILSVVLGVVGLVYASKAKQLGFDGGIRTAGFVLSLIGVIGGAFVFIACIACVGAIGALSAFSY
jgi:type III secretory pathway component EscU